MQEMTSGEVADKVIELFYGRKGFDDWWDQIDYDIRDDLRSDLIDLIREQM